MLFGLISVGKSGVLALLRWMKLVGKAGEKGYPGEKFAEMKAQGLMLAGIEGIAGNAGNRASCI
ncbi:MAG: hypothetical protein WGN25_04195 [Candidatus Electrothrix sp. GW3-4]|uniref:hypothetical protein n=1 Tax=Candidatus Electrothrix sp. GW3-4 TaxID=3126740 RepID=UPI0030D5985E